MYTDNHALSFLNGQEKLSHRHMKWVESLQAYTFIIKHKKGVANKVVDSLSRRVLIVQEVQLQSMGVEALKGLYEEAQDFKEIYKVCCEFANDFCGEFFDYTLQDGLLFKGCQLFILRCSMMDNV